MALAITQITEEGNDCAHRAWLVRIRVAPQKAWGGNVDIRVLRSDLQDSEDTITVEPLSKPEAMPLVAARLAVAAVIPWARARHRLGLSILNVSIPWD